MALLDRIPPDWPDVVADHVTLWGGKGDPAHEVTRAEVVGTAGDGAGVQALVVAIDGTTRRPDGSTYHITWSLDRARGRRAVQSNDVLREQGWRRIEPIPITLIPSNL